MAGRKSDGWPKTGPVACQVRSGGGGAEREVSRMPEEDSRLRGWLGWWLCEKDGAVVEALVGSGGLDVREAGSALGVLEREVEVSERRTAGGRCRRRVKME